MMNYELPLAGSSSKDDDDPLELGRPSSGFHVLGSKKLPPGLRRSSCSKADASSHALVSSPTKKKNIKPRKHRKSQSTSDMPRLMGHFPPRPGDIEPRQESPPVSTIDAVDQSSLHGSFNELSLQFEENVGKPSREALFKFFYPPLNSTDHDHRSRRRKATVKDSHRDNEKLEIISMSSDGEQPRSIEAESLNGSIELQRKVPNPPLMPDKGQNITISLLGQDQPSTASYTSEEHSPIQQENIASIASYTSEENSPIQQESISNNASMSPPSGRPPSTPGSISSLQQNFDAEEEEDRKYVERFWTIYDDIIMLSLFTQIGVVARLAVSTWFTYFDGIFRADSPLFTVLPLNCLSCFLLGLLGSGDRLMEVITTRFTPRKLQHHIAQNVDDDGDDSDENQGGVDNDQEECREENNSYEYNGSELRRRKGKDRRPKRARQIKTDFFRGWQPPIHWHDELREVQLLALERRIRASKCLILFPVRKEDADVMEHYFKEEYKATVHKKEHQKSANSRYSTYGRRRHGRKKYRAAALSDMEDQAFDERHGSPLENNVLIEDDSDGSLPLDQNENENQSSVDDLFKFDLELAPSIERAERVSNGIAKFPGPISVQIPNLDNTPISPVCKIPTDVQKLIKRSPGIASTSQANTPPSPATAPAQQSISTASSPSATRQHQVSPREESGTLTNLQTQRIDANDQASVGTASVDSLFTATEAQKTDPQLEQMISNVQANVAENISRIQRVNIADGWDVGTTPEAMSDDLLLGLRDGFCGALSSFSSWNSSMLDLLRAGHIGEAIIGYVLGLQLPIVAYRFGQQVAVYHFVWQCRREYRRDERRGYGIRVNMDSDDDDDSLARAESTGQISVGGSFEDECSVESTEQATAATQEVPSVRAICTALYLLSLVTQCTSLSFFSEPEDQQIALSLLFSPMGSLARWRLSKLNDWRPGFPIGTFCCNILACSLSGSLGSLLAGNPGPRERTVLTSVIAGFGGTLSSLATFIVEVLAGVDPLLLQFDGLIYAVSSIGWAIVVGFAFSASVDWADETSPTVIVEDQDLLSNSTANSTLF